MGTVANFNLLGENIEVEDTLARKSIFREKKWVCFGDSTAANPGTYINKLIENYKCDIDNQAVGGTSLVASLPIIQAKDISGYDGVIINFGINDWQASAPLWFAYGSTLGFIDTLETLLNWITVQGKQVFVIFPWWCRSKNFPNEINEALCDLPGYIDYGIDVCEKLGVPYLNLYTYAGINEGNYKLMMEDSGDIYVHGLDPVNEFVAAGLFRGDRCNGKCHSARYKFEPCLYDNSLDNIEGRDTGIAGLTNKAYNGQFIVANQGKTVKTCTINPGAGECVTVTGIMVVTGIFNLAMVGEKSDYKIIRRIDSETWRYGSGKFRFSFKVPNGERFYFAVQVGADKPGAFLIGTEFFTDREPVTLSLPNFVDAPLTLSENVHFLSNTLAPVYEINKYGVHFSGFELQNTEAFMFNKFAKINTTHKAGFIQVPAMNLDSTNHKVPTSVNVYGDGWMNVEEQTNIVIVPAFDVITSYC